MNSNSNLNFLYNLTKNNNKLRLILRLLDEIRSYQLSPLLSLLSSVKSPEMY